MKNTLTQVTVYQGGKEASLLFDFLTGRGCNPLSWWRDRPNIYTFKLNIAEQAQNRLFFFQAFVESKLNKYQINIDPVELVFRRGLENSGQQKCTAKLTNSSTAHPAGWYNRDLMIHGQTNKLVWLLLLILYMYFCKLLNLTFHFLCNWMNPEWVATHFLIGWLHLNNSTNNNGKNVCISMIISDIWMIDVSSSRQIWRTVAFHHLLTNDSCSEWVPSEFWVLNSEETVFSLKEVIFWTEEKIFLARNS